MAGCGRPRVLGPVEKRTGWGRGVPPEGGPVGKRHEDRSALPRGHEGAVASLRGSGGRGSQTGAACSGLGVLQGRAGLVPGEAPSGDPAPPASPPALAADAPAAAEHALIKHTLGTLAAGAQGPSEGAPLRLSLSLVLGRARQRQGMGEREGRQSPPPPGSPRPTRRSPEAKAPTSLNTASLPLPRSRVP